MPRPVRSPRRLVAAVLASAGAASTIAAAAVTLGPSPVAAVASRAGVVTVAGAGAVAADHTTVGGADLGYLPTGLGTPSDFTYEFDDVSFVSRDWESRRGDGWRVDLSVAVLRGSPLADARSTRDWVIAYEERPPTEARYRPVRVNGRPGWRSADEVFWLARRGVAVVVRLDTTRWSQHELTRLVDGVRIRR